MSFVTRKSLLLIDSKSRTSVDDATHNFNISYRDTHQMIDVHKIKINKLSIPNAFYNISVTSIFYYFINAVMRTFTLPPGQYTISEIIALFDIYVASVGDITTMDLNNATKKLSLNDAGKTIAIAWAWHPNGDLDLGETLGFRLANTLSDTFPAKFVPNLGGVSNVFIHCSFISNNMTTSRENSLTSDVLTNIQMTSTAFGETLNYDGGDEDYYTFQQGTNLSDFRIYLTDSTNNIVNLNGADWSMVCSIWSHA